MAQDTAPPGFGAAAQFRLGVGARALAMGGAYTAVAGGVESLYWNPAGLPGARLSMGGTQIYPFAGAFGPSIGIQAQYMGAAVPWGTLGVGVGWFNARVVDIPYVTDDDIVLYFNYDSSLLALGGGAAWSFGEGLVASGGAAVKLYRESMLDGRAQGFGWDVGLLLDFGRWRVGYASQDVLGTRYRWQGTGQEPVVEVPWVQRLGVMARWLDGGLVTTADAVLEIPVALGFRLGVEWVPVEFLAVRGGLRLEPTAGQGFWPVWTVGVGVAWELFFLDAAFLGRPLPTYEEGLATSANTYLFSFGVRL